MPDLLKSYVRSVTACPVAAGVGESDALRAAHEGATHSASDNGDVHRSAIPSLLAAAHSNVRPGEVLPPGPRVNHWASAGARGTICHPDIAELLDGLWRSGARHVDGDGVLTSIPRRPVPSAGASYGVQTHILIGPDQPAYGASGWYVYDHTAHRLLRRDRRTERLAGWPGFATPRPGIRVVFTMQPGRSFGRYRHRAWPLWIADTAYAAAALEFLTSRTLPPDRGPSRALRDLMQLPPASDPSPWLALSLVPEIPLLSCQLDLPLRLDQRRLRALRARRSAPIALFTPPTRKSEHARVVAELADQPWLEHADRLHTWTSSASAPRTALLHTLWSAHLEAARLCYRMALTDGATLTRPVSGIRAHGASWIVHALAVIDAEKRRATGENPS